MNVTKKTSYLHASIVCLLGAAFYLYEFILQVSPSVITSELMRDFHIHAAGVGFLSASYFYAYMPMQFPAGLLYDRYGPRILLTIMVLVCAIGALLFSHSNSLAMMILGRSMIGFGSAFAFVGTLVLVSRWFPASLFPIITGIVQAMSSVGAIVGTLPFAAAVANYGWRQSTFWLGLLGFGLAMIMWLVVRDSPKGHIVVRHRYQNEWKRLLLVCRNPQTWLVGFYAFAMWAPITVFAALWGITYLREVYSVTTVVASSYITLIWVGVAVGSPTLGFFSQLIKRRCLPLYLMSILGLIISLILIYQPHILSGWMIYALMFFFGFSAAGCILTFSLVKENNDVGIVGSAVGFNNMMVVTGGAILQPLVGIILNDYWDGEMVDSIPVYSLEAYRMGMLTIPVCYLISMVLAIFLIRETRCKVLYHRA